MKNYLVLVILFQACSTQQPEQICREPMVSHQLYRGQGISISLPPEFKIVDSAKMDPSKFLVDVRRIYSVDSTKSLFVLINDFQEAGHHKLDTAALKQVIQSDISIEGRGKDSTLSIVAKNLNGWATAAQISFISSEDPHWLASVFSAKQGKQIQLILRLNQIKGVDGGQQLKCILSSYSVAGERLE